MSLPFGKDKQLRRRRPPEPGVKDEGHLRLIRQCQCLACCSEPADPKGAAEFAYRRFESRVREMFREIQNKDTAHDAAAPISANSDAPKGAEDGCHIPGETQLRPASVPPHAPEAALMTEAIVDLTTKVGAPRSSTHAAEKPREQAGARMAPIMPLPARKNPPVTEGDQATERMTTKVVVPDPTIAPARARRRKASDCLSTIELLPSDAQVSADHAPYETQITCVSSPAASCGGEPIPSNGGDVEGHIGSAALVRRAFQWRVAARQ